MSETENHPEDGPREPLEHQAASDRPATPGSLHGLLRHWQVLLAVALLAVGSVGLLTTESRPSCTVQDAEAIPQDRLEDLEAASEESGFPVSVLAAQIEAESGWNNQAHSHAGAVGLAQFTQDTWDLWGEGDRTDESDSIAAQGRYMAYLRSQLEDQAGGDEEKLTRYALAGYNAGPNSVKKARGIPDYPETRNYVEKIMRLSHGKYARSCH